MTPALPIIKVSDALRKTIESILTDFAQKNDFDVTRSMCSGAPIWVLYDPFRDAAQSWERVVVVVLEEEKGDVLYFLPTVFRSGHREEEKPIGILIRDIRAPDWLFFGEEGGLDAQVKAQLRAGFERDTTVWTHGFLEEAWHRASEACTSPEGNLLDAMARLERIRRYAEQFKDLDPFQSVGNAGQMLPGPG